VGGYGLKLAPSVETFPHHRWNNQIALYSKGYYMRDPL